MPNIGKEQRDSVLHLSFINTKPLLLLLVVTAFSRHASERNINQECWQRGSLVGCSNWNNSTPEQLTRLRLNDLLKCWSMKINEEMNVAFRASQAGCVRHVTKSSLLLFFN